MTLIEVSAVIVLCFVATVLVNRPLRDRLNQTLQGFSFKGLFAKRVTGNQAMSAAQAGMVDRLTEIIQAADARQDAYLSELSSDIAKVRTDLEWLMGEHAIEQAIKLARTGADATEISANTGLNLDDSKTIIRFRTH